MNLKFDRKQKKAKRLRAQIFGTTHLPRLSVARSNKGIYAQVIDDSKGITLATASDHNIKERLPKLEKAKIVGQILGGQIIKLGIKAVIFDRRGFKFHGRVKALAEGVLSTGIKSR